MQAATVSVEATPIAASDDVPAPIAAAFVVFPPPTPLPAGERPQADPEPAVFTGARKDAEPRLATRRYAHGELLLAAFIGARRALTFEDLAGVLVGTGARVSELVGWMASSQANGLIVSQGFQLDPVGIPTGPRLFALSDEARAELRARRSRRRTCAAT